MSLDPGRSYFIACDVTWFDWFLLLHTNQPTMVYRDIFVPKASADRAALRVLRYSLSPVLCRLLALLIFYRIHNLQRERAFLSSWTYINYAIQFLVFQLCDLRVDLVRQRPAPGLGI